MTDDSNFQKELTEKENANVVSQTGQGHWALDTANTILQEPQVQMRISVLINKLPYFSEAWKF